MRNPFAAPAPEATPTGSATAEITDGGYGPGPADPELAEHWPPLEENDDERQRMARFVVANPKANPDAVAAHRWSIRLRQARANKRDADAQARAEAADRQARTCPVCGLPSLVFDAPAGPFAPAAMRREGPDFLFVDTPNGRVMVRGERDRDEAALTYSRVPATGPLAAGQLVTIEGRTTRACHSCAFELQEQARQRASVEVLPGGQTRAQVVAAWLGE